MEVHRKTLGKTEALVKRWVSRVHEQASFTSSTQALSRLQRQQFPLVLARAP